MDDGSGIRFFKEAAPPGPKQSRRRRTGRSLVGLVSATVWAQLVNILAAPLLARWFEPAAFGALSVTLSVAAVAGAVAAGRFEWAVALPSTREAARGVVRAALVCASATSLLGFLVVFVGQEPLAGWMGDEASQTLLLAPAIMFLLSILAALTQCSLREQNFGLVSRQTVASATTTPLLQGVFALVSRQGVSLAAGAVLGRLVAVVMMLRSNADYVRGEADWRSSIRRYWHFPLLFAPSSLLNVLGTNLPILVFGITFGAAQAGQLGMAQRIVLLPSTIVGSAVGQIYLARLTESIRLGIGDVRRQYLWVTVRMLLPGLAIAVASWLVAPRLFTLVLGSEWRAAGEFASAMALSVGLGFVVSPLTFVFVAFERTAASIAVDLSRIFLVGGAAILAQGRHFEAAATILVMYTGQTINYVISWVVGLWIVSDGSSANPADSRDRSSHSG